MIHNRFQRLVSVWIPWQQRFLLAGATSWFGWKPQSTLWFGWPQCCVTELAVPWPGLKLIKTFEHLHVVLSIKILRPHSRHSSSQMPNSRSGISRPAVSRAGRGKEHTACWDGTPVASQEGSLYTSPVLVDVTVYTAKASWVSQQWFQECPDLSVPISASLH